MENKTIKPLSLKIDSDLWESFKEITPRTITLNNAVIELIKKEVREYGLSKS